MFPLKHPPGGPDGIQTVLDMDGLGGWGVDLDQRSKSDFLIISLHSASEGTGRSAQG